MFVRKNSVLPCCRPLSGGRGWVRSGHGRDRSHAGASAARRREDRECNRLLSLHIELHGPICSLERAAGWLTGRAVQGFLAGMMGQSAGGGKDLSWVTDEYLVSLNDPVAAAGE